MAWATSAAEIELGLPAGTLEREQSDIRA